MQAEKDKCMSKIIDREVVMLEICGSAQHHIDHTTTQL